MNDSGLEMRIQRFGWPSRIGSWLTALFGWGLLLAAPVRTESAGLVINEIHYDPAHPADLTEFIEIYNAGSNAVDLGGYFLAEGVQFRFPAGILLDRDAYLVVAENPAALTHAFGSIERLVGPFDGRLDNDGETLILCDASSNLVDRVTYRQGFPWPTAAGGDISSIELMHPDLDNDLGGNWRASGYPGSAPPTPGRLNSVWTNRSPPIIRQVDHDPAQPPAQVPVVITAKITDRVGVADVTLRYQVVPPGNYIPAFLPLDHSVLLNDPLRPLSTNPVYFAESNWVSVAMRDDGGGPDRLAGDSIFSGQIAGQTNRSLVRYRIVATGSEGVSLGVPYADDPSLNFAYYVYDGLPPYVAAERSIQPDGPGHIYDTNLLAALPIYTLITRSNDLAHCNAYASAWQIPRTNREALSKFNWEGAWVHAGRVYDHVFYRLRQFNDRYSYDYGGMGKRSMRIRFLKGNYLQAHDEYGRAYPRPWRTLNTGKLFSNKGIGNFGLVDSLNMQLWSLVGIPAPRTHWFHFRVITGRDECPAGTNRQYLGDFWGLNLAMEDYDARFLDAHDLPDGNLYKLTSKITDGNRVKRHQGRQAVTNDADFQNIRLNLLPDKTDEWLDRHVNYEKWYPYFTVCLAIRHIDFLPYDNWLKNRAWFFELLPEHTNGIGRLWTLPYDTDVSWGPDYGSDVAPFGLARDYSGAAILDGGGKPAYLRELRNSVREFRDLIWTEEAVGQMLEEMARLIRDFSQADRDRWREAPGLARQDFGALDDKIQDMKNFAFSGWSAWYGLTVPDGGRAGMLDSFADGSGDAEALPLTPMLWPDMPPGFPINRLVFRCIPFLDPQGETTFGAMQWRCGEITPAGEDAGGPRTYEAAAVWKSAVLSNFTDAITLPASAVKVGHTYRTRVRMRDDDGHWSHWSPPVEFTVGPPDNALELEAHLRISELMYQPAGDGDMEFVELHNTGTNFALNLNGVKVADGIEYDFGENQILEPGGFLVLVKVTSNDFSRFRQFYGLSETVALVGPFAGKLDNAGESVSVKIGTAGKPVVSLSYDDGPGWPIAAAGGGHSLIPRVLEVQTNGILSYGGNWQASHFLNGSPGRAEPAPIANVVINEILAHTDYSDSERPEYDSNDWIELYNPTEQTLSLENWFLSDDPADLKKWAIPATNFIGARACIVFDEVTGFHQPITAGFGISKAGERIYLSYRAGGSADRVADAVILQGQANNRSVGRFPDGQPSWMPLRPTRGTTNEPAGAHVMIGEIMFHPRATALNPEDNTHDEYVEIYNPLEEPVPLWTAVGPWRLTDGVSYYFPTGVTLTAAERLTLVSFDPADAVALSNFCGVYALSGQMARILGPYSGKLNNAGERIALEMPQAADQLGDPVSWITVDEVSYSSQIPWPAGADGSGESLARTGGLPGDWGNTPEHWTISAPSPGQSSAALIDLDGDSLPHQWEQRYGFSDWNRDDAFGDADGDGLGNVAEFVADTDPTNKSSHLRLSAIGGEGPGVRVNWQGGTASWQMLERGSLPDATTVVWRDVFTNPPPTSSDNSFVDMAGTGAVWFYRVRVERH